MRRDHPTTATQERLAEFFRGELGRDCSVCRREETRWYLGDLLARFGSSDALFSHDQGRLDLRPLALLYDDANQCRDERERCLLMRQLGDQALFVGALCPEHFARRGIQRDYFVGMGGGAYDYLAGHATVLQEVYAELAEGFARFLELITSILRTARKLDSSDILALYSRWQRSGNPALASQLRGLGITLDEGRQRH